MNKVAEQNKNARIPNSHITFLDSFLDKNKFKVVYDIGSAVLHWHDEAAKRLPDAKIYCFEACYEVESLYIERGVKYFLGVLGSKKENKKVEINKLSSLINVYYENTRYSGLSDNNFYYSDREVQTLSHIVESSGLPLPDLVKMDVQGSELDIVKGGTYIIQNAKAVILELPHVEYNLDAPNKDEIIEFMNSIGFDNAGEFCRNGYDGDFLFLNRNNK